MPSAQSRLLACLLLAAGAARATVKIPVNDETYFTLGLLAQMQAVGTRDGAPDGTDPSTDIFVRRLRLLLGGYINKSISFTVETDQANFGKKGNFDVQFALINAFVSFALAKEAIIDVGFMPIPASRGAMNGALKLHTIDFHNPLLIYPGTRSNREVGIELRGAAFADRVQYRFGVFDGVQGASAAGVGNGLNPPDIPRLAGMVRYNLFGSEPAYFIPNIYFSATPVVSIGAGWSYQYKGTLGPGGTGTADLLAWSADAFAEWPTGDDQGIIGNVAYHGYRAGDGSKNTGDGGYLEVGYRVGRIEPTLAVDIFKADDPSGAGDYLAFRGGLNYWIEKHGANLKAEFQNERRGPSTAKRGYSITMQAQLLF